MGKVAKTIIKVGIGAAIVAAAFVPGVNAAVAGFLGTAFAGMSAGVAAGLTGAILGALKIAGGMVITAALTSAAKAFMKKPGLGRSLADRLNRQIDGTATRQFVFGQTAMGTKVRFLEKYGSKKDQYVEVWANASHRINAFLGVYFEDELTWSPATGNTGKYANGVAFTFRTEGSMANAVTLGTGAYWAAPGSRFTGCAYMAALFKLDEKIWTEGIPSRLTVVGEGAPVCDPRRGCDPANNATWVYKDANGTPGRNNALCALTYLLGWRINGVLVWGMGVPPSRINFANIMAYANLCEEQVATAGGGTTQRYTCDYIGSTEDSHDATLNAICAAMGSCKLVDVDGLYQFIGGYDDTLEPMVTLTEDDFIGGYERRTAAPMFETFNAIRGRFPRPDMLYQLDDYPMVEVNPRPDGIPRVMALDLGAVSRGESCQRIARQHLVRELFSGTLGGVIGPRGFLCQVGKLVKVNLPSEGFNGKIYRVAEQTEPLELIFQMSFREDDALVYAWDYNEAKPLPPAIRPPGYDPSDMLTPQGFTLTTDSETGNGQSSLPVLVFNWTPETSGRVSGIELSWRVDTEAAWTVVPGLVDPTLGAFRSPGPPGARNVVGRARFRMSNGLFGPFTSEDTAATPIAVYGAAPADLELISQALERADEAYALADGQVVIWFGTEATPAGQQQPGDWLFDQSINKWKRWNGAQWIIQTDADIPQALTAAAGAQATADSKIVTFYSESQPAPSALGDLWYQPSTNMLRRWNGSAWVDVANIGATPAQLSLIANAQDRADQAYALADGQIVIWYGYEYTPGGAQQPGDWLWDVSVNKWKRWTGGAWVIETDAGIPQAINAAAGAQATADGKVTTYYQSSAPGAPRHGDLWVHTGAGNRVYRWADGIGWQQITGGLAALDTVGTGQIDPAAVSTPKLVDNATFSLSTSSGTFGFFGWRSTAFGLKYIGPSAIYVQPTNGPETGSICIIRFFFVAERDGGDDDNISITMQRQDGYQLQTYTDVQMHGGKRLYMCEFVDPDPVPNTSYWYAPMYQSLQDGDPTFYHYTLIADLRKK